MLQLLVLIGINILLILFILLIKLPKILDIIDIRIERCRRFIDKNEGFFSILFIVLFTTEQVLLIILIFLFKENIDIIKIIVSIFSLVVITTATLQKLILEIKRKYDKERITAARKAKRIIQKLIATRKEKNIIQKLKEQIEKS